MMDLSGYLKRQEEWSGRTFGHGTRTIGIIQHIRKELEEILQNPHDLEEWIDVVILALDGYWRHGGDPKHIMFHLQAKQQINFSRHWPPPGPEDQPTEHIRQSA